MKEMWEAQYDLFLPSGEYKKGDCKTKIEWERLIPKNVHGLFWEWFKLKP